MTMMARGMTSLAVGMVGGVRGMTVMALSVTGWAFGMPLLAVGMVGGGRGMNCRWVDAGGLRIGRGADTQGGRYGVV